MWTDMDSVDSMDSIDRSDVLLLRVGYTVGYVRPPHSRNPTLAHPQTGDGVENGDRARRLSWVAATSS